MNVGAHLALFKKTAFENAVRLFEDASLLFENRRYPAALALAATSFEELGKMHLIDRGCDSICMNPEAFDKLYNMYFAGPWLTKHLFKQRRALFDALDLSHEQEESLSAWVNDGGLEHDRQIALYVELNERSVESPGRITKEKAKRVLEMCYTGLTNSAELAFNGFAAESSAKIDWLANKAIKQIETAHARWLDA